MATCIIVEDEPVSQELLASYISNIKELQLVATCNNAIDAGEHLRTHPVDLLFLDINLPRLSGTAFYSSLVNPPAVILTTAYPEYAVEGFELNAVDYLVKPFGFDRFMKAVTKYLTLQKPEPVSYIILEAGKKTHKVELADITFVEAMGDYVKVRIKDDSLVVHQTMSRLMEQLPVQMFRRIHKSFIISINRMEFIEGNTVVVDGNRIPIGQTYRSELLSALNRK
jgi:DNA-binding LytR/AlgR family response regulator